MIFYPSMQEISCLEHIVSFLPESLKLLLELMFLEHDKEPKVVSIDQAIMQAGRPRVLIAPMQLGVGVQMHHHFDSRFLISSLSQHGFCCSYSEGQRYETNAFSCKGLEIPHLTNEQFVQYVADNVDHNIRTFMDGIRFLGMGIVSTVTPALGKWKFRYQGETR